MASNDYALALFIEGDTVTIIRDGGDSISSAYAKSFDIEQIVSFYFSEEFLILWTIKVLVGLLVHKDVFMGNSLFMQSYELPILILLSGADPNITINGHNKSLRVR